LELIFGLLLIAGIFKLLEWIFSFLLNKIGGVVYPLKQYNLEEERKKNSERVIAELIAEMKNNELKYALMKQAKSDALLDQQQNTKIMDEYASINKRINPINTNKNIHKKDSTENFQNKKAYSEPIEDDPLKAKGDRYERYIGKRFEDKGELVIYNGFILGFEDGGVDIAVISKDTKTINLVQCKHWSLKILELDHIEKIYEKLNTHNLDFLRLSANQINEQLSTKKQNIEIEKSLLTAQNNEKTLLIRKTLYISSDKVVDLEIGKHLIMMQPNIFRYQDMKIVVEKHL
jgi:hypothetical protein